MLAVARVMDRTWRKMPALITVAYHTGLRVGSILRARGRDLDLDAGTLVINRTKNNPQAFESVPLFSTYSVLAARPTSPSPK